MDSYLTKIQFRQDSEANWRNVNPILSAGEPGYEIDTNRWKLGDGINTWNNLEYRDGVYNPNLPSNPELPPQQPNQPTVVDKLNSFSFNTSSLNLENNKATFNGNLSYTTEQNSEATEVEGNLSLNIKGSDNVSLTNDNGALKVDLNQEFISKFNYLDQQAQTFVEDYEKYSDFASALDEFMSNEGLEILGFKLKILQDLSISYYTWEIKTDGTVTKQLNPFKVLDRNSTLVSFNFKYNDDLSSITIQALDSNDPVLIKVSTTPTDGITVTPSPSASTTTDGYLNIPAIGQSYGVSTLFDNEEEGGIDNMIQFSIIGLDKTGVNKRK